MLRSVPVFFAHCMRRLLPVLWPVNARIMATGGGLYCVEEETDDGWRLRAVSFRLEDAFSLAETLNAAPERFARLSRPVTGTLPASYGVATDDGWRGAQFWAAVRDASFAAAVRPGEAFRNDGWRCALKLAVRLLGRGETVVLLGDPGIGKTVFLQDLAQALTFEGSTVRVVRPGDPETSSADVHALLVDDAHLLGQQTLDALLGPGLPALFSFRPGFEGPVMSVRPTAHILQIGTLEVGDVARFVASRLKRAGRVPGLADADAVLALAHLSGGVPRQITRLAGAAIFLADIECSPRLLLRHVEHAAVAGRLGGAVLQSPACDRIASLRPATWAARQADFSKSAWARGRLGVASAVLAIALLASWAKQIERQPEILPWLTPNAGVTTGSANPSNSRVASVEPVANGPTEPGEAAGTPSARRPPLAEPGGQLGGAGHPSAAREELDQAGRRQFQGGVSLAGDTDKAQISWFSDMISGTAGPAPRHPEDGLDSVLQASLGSFHGPVSNETLRLTGKLSLEVTRMGPPGMVRARFHAWDGLLGNGELTGTLSPDGHLTLSGLLSMGRNQFNCRLSAVIKGNRITGSAQFVRPWGGRVAYSSFNLLKT